MAITDIQAQVLATTGNTPTADSVEDAQRFVASGIPKDLLWFASSQLSIQNDTGIGVSSGDTVLTVHRNGYPSSEVAFSMSKLIDDSNSLHKATIKNPKHYNKEGYIFIKPSPTSDERGYVTYVDHTQIDDDSNLRSAVSHYCCSQEFQRLSKTKISTWSSITAPNSPVSPSFGNDLTIASSNSASSLSLTSVTFNDVVGGDANAPTFYVATVSAGGVYGSNTPPSYSKPVLSLSTLSTINDLNITTQIPTPPVIVSASASLTGIAPVYNQPVIALTDAPTVGTLNIQATAPSTPNISANTAFIGNAPTYTKPTLNGVTGITTFPTLSWSLPSKPLAPQIQANSSSSGGSEVDTSKLATAPTFTPPVMQSADWSDVDNWINAEEDPEMSTARVQAISAQISEYQAKLNESQQAFNEENIEYQAKLQIALQDANQGSQGDSSLINQYGSEVQAYSQEVNSIIQSNVQQVQEWQTQNAVNLQEYSASIQNELNEFNKENVKYQAELQLSIQNAQLSQADDSQVLQKFQGEIQNYQAKVNDEVQEFQSNLQADLELWKTHRQTELQKYATDIQNNLNSFNESNVVYQATLQKDLQTAQLSDSYESKKLQQYQSDIQSYQQEVNKTLQEFSANYQKNIQVFNAENQSKLSAYQADIQSELNEFNKENVAYQSNIQESMQELQVKNQTNIAEAQAQLQVAIRNKDREQEVKLQNAINDMQAIVQNNNSTISKFQAESQNYVANVNTEVQTYANNLSKKVQEYQSELAKYNADIQKYNSELSQEAQKNGLLTQQASLYSGEAQKYYQWAVQEVNMYVQNNSRVIESRIQAQAQQGGQ